MSEHPDYPGFESVPIEDEPPPRVGQRKPAVNGHAGHAKAKKPEAPSFVMLRDLNLSRDVFWAIEDTLPRCSMMLVYGPGGSGKTYLAASVAIGMAMGLWFGRSTEPGSVLYCAFERPDDATDRLAALRDKLGLHDVPLALLDRAGQALNEAVADEIIAEAKALATATGKPVRCIPIDTVAAALGGQREDEEGLGRLRMLGERIHKETGAQVMWLHHEGKSEGRGPRGHLTLADACLVWWRVELRQDGSRIVHVDKANRGPVYQPLFAFKLAPFVAGQDCRGKDIELCEVELVDLDGALLSPIRQRGWQPKGQPPARGRGANQKLLLHHLRKLTAKNPGGVDEGLVKSAFLQALAATRTSSGKPPLDARRWASIWNKTLSSLLDDEVIERDGTNLLFLEEDGL